MGGALKVLGLTAAVVAFAIVIGFASYDQVSWAINGLWNAMHF